MRRKIGAGGEVWQVYGMGGELLAEYGAEAAAATPTGADIRWLVSDQLGTPRMVVDRTGSLAGVRRHDYLPFGEEIGAGVGVRTTGQGYSQPDGMRQGFTGYEKDGETGLNYAQARYHSPAQGRFTSPDPLIESADAELPQSWNRYTYILNNPLLLVDPTGLIWGYKDLEDGQREFAWCAGDKPCEGYEPYTEYTYTFGDGRVVWLNQEEGTWGVVEPIRPENSCLYCADLVREMQSPKTWDRAAAGVVWNATLGRILGRIFGRSSASTNLPGLPKSAPKPLGRGSTGRATPKNFNEQLAMEQARSNPAAGNPIPLRKGMTDTRWPASDGWVKMSQNVNGVEIHYVMNTRTGKVDDFKFID